MAETIKLEVFFARFPAGNAALNGPLWNDIDEQSLPPAIRRELADAGLRAGLVGTQVPVELARLLTLSDAPVDPAEANTVDLEQEPAVTKRLLAVRPNRRSELIASTVYDTLSLLMRDEGQVVGRTYAKAEGRFALRASEVAGGRVQVELTPELHYGEQQQRWNAADGVIRLEASRPKRVFDELKLAAQLEPGQMLIVSCQPDRPGTLGHCFFTEPKADSLMQKFLVIRIAEAGSDRSFAEHPRRRRAGRRGIRPVAGLRRIGPADVCYATKYRLASRQTSASERRVRPSRRGPPAAIRADRPSRA